MHVRPSAKWTGPTLMQHVAGGAADERPRSAAARGSDDPDDADEQRMTPALRRADAWSPAGGTGSDHVLPALPTIVGELGGVDRMLWVTTAYVLAGTVVMPVYGKLGDLLGRKPLFIAALSVFLAGSLLGGLATDMTWLIVARAVQGLGGGGLLILIQAIIADVVPARERAASMSVVGAVFALSAMLGPVLGGWLTDGLGWRWAFWINLLWARRRLPRAPLSSRRPAGASDRSGSMSPASSQ